jgi:excisionase family DNA binding protein
MATQSFAQFEGARKSGTLAPAQRTVSVEQAARELGIGRSSGYAAAHRGDLPTIKIGRRLLVPRAALDRLLMDHRAA